MGDHPYKHRPDYCFWRPSIAATDFRTVDPVVRGKFKLGKNHKIATAGSCFAQHIARYLQIAGYNYFVVERPHPAFAGWFTDDYNYGTFSARFGNLYTSRQLLQLLERAYQLFCPFEDVWTNESGRFVDPFRPQIQPGGFSSIKELQLDRKQHFSAVRTMVEELDVFVFTLGLTEAWVGRDDGAVLPLCPGVAGGIFDGAKYEYRNFSVSDVTSDLRNAIDFIQDRNPRARFILTVSPVPLVATMEDRSVLVSTAYSKAVLRVAADVVANESDSIAYFPSFEIITGQHAGNTYFEPDLRSIRPDGVAHVMGLFAKHYLDDGENSDEKPDSAIDEQMANHRQRMTDLAKLICEEESLNRQ
ncbi:GSCFA domain-containing protein [Acidiphilium sp. AL]|uniref:GSCFA domain-containing protein n=1 Tax=Acidiphilium iwatense TaxID=768198 RepID=A0ABS9DSN4_9PROT|nr:MULTISPECIES: GSCFA domain-containing protein [Acidiphilium]MCF3945669.1 GSCFA domain-containing protein [Acidiphilium iwatense]MCU4159527.1 GSCFA domain-containing protein [Acidiphilium sp. AL]